MKVKQKNHSKAKKNTNNHLAIEIYKETIQMQTD